MHCKYIPNNKCSFNGVKAICKDKNWDNPEECIIYQLIKDIEYLKEKVKNIT